MRSASDKSCATERTLCWSKAEPDWFIIGIRTARMRDDGQWPRLSGGIGLDATVGAARVIGPQRDPFPSPMQRSELQSRQERDTLGQQRVAKSPPSPARRRCSLVAVCPDHPDCSSETRCALALRAHVQPRYGAAGLRSVRPVLSPAGRQARAQRPGSPRRPPNNGSGQRLSAGQGRGRGPADGRLWKARAMHPRDCSRPTSSISTSTRSCARAVRFWNSTAHQPVASGSPSLTAGAPAAMSPSTSRPTSVGRFWLLSGGGRPQARAPRRRASSFC